MMLLQDLAALAGRILHEAYSVLEFDVVQVEIKPVDSSIEHACLEFALPPDNTRDPHPM